MKASIFTLAFGAVLAVAPVASAHVVFDRPESISGGYYTGFLRVSHGCEGSPTVSVSVTLPEGIVTARPQPKAGWTIMIENEALATPVQAEGGKMLTERVARITWRGFLDDSMFDQFGLSVKLPAAEGPLYFPVVQACEKGENRWADIPPAGAAWHSVPHPAPVVELAPAPHAHH